VAALYPAVGISATSQHRARREKSEAARRPGNSEQSPPGSVVDNPVYSLGARGRKSGARMEIFWRAPQRGLE
jgi:hypothetical protein